MEPPPLTLNILRLTPATLLLPPPTASNPADIEDVPLVAATRPSLPSSFSFSPTHNYPAPFGSMTLGSTLSVSVQLIATPPPISSPRPGDITDAPRSSLDGLAPTRKDKLGADGVGGVKMMLEVQGPGGRWRLGEIIHGEQPSAPPLLPPAEESDADGKVTDGGDPSVQTAAAETSELPSKAEMADKPAPVLPSGEYVELDCQAEMKELGLQVLICSVAWETPTGRRTFQRFFKFNVVAPLSIKTKIHPSQTPSSLLDPHRRSDVYLEVLMQNTSNEAMSFDKVNLEPVFGMTSKTISANAVPLPDKADSDAPDNDALGSLHPGDTRQYLFLLHPDPPSSSKSRQSVFAPIFAPGTVLPLGRLDMVWVAGPYRERGRLQTSTLNRRVAAPPVVPKISVAPASAAMMARTSSTGVSAPGPSALGTPGRFGGSFRERGAEDDEWDYDLAVVDLDRSGVEAEKDFTAKLRIGVRSRAIAQRSANEDDPLRGEAPESIRLALQYLSVPLASPLASANPSVSAVAPSRSRAPVSSATTSRNDLTRPFSPSTPPAKAGPSRPMTPISSALRHGTQSHLNLQSAIGEPNNASDIDITHDTTADISAFPPPPTFDQPPLPPPKHAHAGQPGSIFPLGSSLVHLPPIPFELAQEQYSTTYADSAEPPERWEAVYEASLSFLALEEGLVTLGGVRLLVLDDDSGLKGRIAREWETLGEVLVSG